MEELRRKSWEDLHSLWYMCCKENNRIATENRERQRLNLTGAGGPAKRRAQVVCFPGLVHAIQCLRLCLVDLVTDLALQIRETQRSIKHALTERWYAWEAAWKVAEKDPEVDLNAKPDTSAYKPLEDEVFTLLHSSNVSQLTNLGRSRHMSQRSKKLLERHLQLDDGVFKIDPL